MKYVVTMSVILAASQCPTSPPGEEEKAKEEKSGKQAEETADEPKADASAADEEKTRADAGSDSKPDVDNAPDTAWLEPGPPPFDVPTRRLALPDGLGTIRVPIGTRAETTPAGLELKLGEGKNYWLRVHSSVPDSGEDLRERFDLTTLRTRLEKNQTIEIVDDRRFTVQGLDQNGRTLIWRENDRWYVRTSLLFTDDPTIGAFGTMGAPQVPYACENPRRANHDLRDVEMMAASCRSIWIDRRKTEQPTEAPE